jgi:hypothetical protein
MLHNGILKEIRILAVVHLSTDILNLILDLLWEDHLSMLSSILLTLFFNFSDAIRKAAVESVLLFVHLFLSVVDVFLI